tara:strand:+ start:2742 stop:3725 length:984 start_codon:yes stop_codon:yes gene_type:complete
MDMRKKLLCGLGLAGLLSLPTFATADSNDLNRSGIFNALHTEETIDVQQSTSDLVAGMVDKTDTERFDMANQYIQAHELTTRRYMNLVEALKMLGMQASYTNELTALYAVKRQGKFTMDTLYKLLNTLSLNAYYADSSAKNWAGQIVSVHLKNRSTTFYSFSNLVWRTLKRRDMNAQQLDQLVLLSYVKNQGAKLETKEFQKVISMSDKTYLGVQSKALLVEEYVKKNAYRLTNPEFRQWVVDYRRKVPVGKGVYSVNSMSEEARDRLFYCEDSYFGSLFFGLSSVIEAIEQGLQDSEWKIVSEMFIERNQHRLGKYQIGKLRKAFP